MAQSCSLHIPVKTYLSPLMLVFFFFFPAVMWNVYGECENFATLKGHSGAVMELHYNTDGRCGHGHPQSKTNWIKETNYWDDFAKILKPLL